MTTSVATSIIGAINTTMTASIIPKFMAPERLWWLFGTLALLAGYVAMQFRRKRDTVLFTNVALLDKIAPKRPGWRRHVVAAGFLLAMVAGIGAMAQPMGTVQVPKDRATIILAIDTSLSMEAADVSPDRISAAKAAAKDFVSKLPPKINVGLISFNASAVLRQSPTQDRVACARPSTGWSSVSGPRPATPWMSLSRPSRDYHPTRTARRRRRRSC